MVVLLVSPPETNTFISRDLLIILPVFIVLVLLLQCPVRCAVSGGY
jgi:hypothetical protein